ncbi:uncharacterized protein LOC115629326 [Scaptodrosophila lebanonensis]|uniref:Uncharacterized protein LOC115629326 n=1 Tax=Drosophila lebanonensis TaxID=7225 RepID=A0A6J2TZV6_DROLE|nr:uncharacterized protein LOC115629326 [Scaptodrosophila lebanonensis]
MANNLIAFALIVLVCLAASSLAAPSPDDLAKYGELERTLKELSTSILAMTGAGAAEVSSSDVLGGDNDNAGALSDMNEF